MTPTEALNMLDQAATHSGQSKINPSFSCEETKKIVRDGILEIQEQSGERPLYRIMQKRVYQVVRNQRRPKFQYT
jgi:hypothetical protein